MKKKATNQSDISAGVRCLKGWVYIMGAGPGDPQLLTMKAYSILQQLDILFYDALVSDEILELIPLSVERIYVGKKEGCHSVPQEEINRLLISAAKLGQSVGRLKGGDPFVFGRGSEEALALTESKVPFEIVPGLSSSVTGAAYAGIPVTHRGLAESFTVVTGHICGDQFNYDRVRKASNIDTIIFLMGVNKRVDIAKCLIECGRCPNEEVAFVERASTPSQKVVYSTLQEVADDRIEVSSPAIFVVGKVVGLSRKIQWFYPNLSRSLLNNYQDSFPLCVDPFAQISSELNISKERIISEFEELKNRNLISRIGGVIKSRSIGYSSLVAISVKPDQVLEVSSYVNSFSEVNHNYLRDHEFNMWFVVTAPNRDDFNKVIEKIESVNNNGPALVLPLVKDYHIDLGFSLPQETI